MLTGSSVASWMKRLPVLASLTGFLLVLAVGGSAVATAAATAAGGAHGSRGSVKLAATPTRQAALGGSLGTRSRRRPTISGFSPASGAVGASVTISGSNFLGASAVAFNGTAASYTVVSSTRITT